MDTVGKILNKWPPMVMLLGVLGWQGTPLAMAMDIEQMRTIAGVEMLESRVNQVLEAYGQASAILPTETTDQEQTALPAGDWSLVYTPPESASDHHSQQPAEHLLSLNNFSRLELYARGGVGEVIVRRKPQKTTYEIPHDPYRAHQVISLSAVLRQAIPVSRLISHFGDQYEEIKTPDKIRWLRFWVKQRQGEMPHKLYAVDFGLNADGDKVTILVASGPQVDFVTEALVSQYKLWEQNLYD